MTPRANGLALAALMLLATPGAASAQTSFNVGGVGTSLQVTSLRDMPFRTVVRQQYDYSCGSAALATLLTHHYGRPSSEATIFKAMYAKGNQAQIRKVGFSLLDMKTYLAGIGLPADGYRRTVKDLAAFDAPVIALIKVGQYRHFVIVKGVRGGQVLVGDPSLGLKAYPVAEFAKVWDGVIFKISPPAGTLVRYDRDEEWGHLGRGPDALDDTALANMTRELPPIYQIATTRNGGFIR